jgi:hypothetical protein
MLTCHARLVDWWRPANFFFMQKGLAMALPPHWLDDVIGENRDLDTILAAISNSDKFSRLIQEGIDEGLELEKRAKDPGYQGPTFAQQVRRSIVDGFNIPQQFSY